MKQVVNILNVFNKPYRIPALDQYGRPSDSYCDAKDIDASSIDIQLDGHYTVEQLSQTKVFGELFKTGVMTFGSINPIAERVHSSFTRPVDGLLRSSSLNHPSLKYESTIDEDSVFSLLTSERFPDGIRCTQTKRDKRDVTFISLVNRPERPAREAVAFE